MSSPITNSVILPNLSESVFRLYEPHIAEAVSRWPDETKFERWQMMSKDRKPISKFTFAGRLRDAILSLRRFGWQTTTIDKAKLESMAGSYVISFGPNDTVVWAKKHKENTGRPQAPVHVDTPLSPATLGADQGSWTNPTEDEVRALCILLDRQRIQGPVTLAVVLPQSTIDALQSEFAVSISTSESSTIIA